MRALLGFGIIVSLVAFMSCASNPEGARSTTTDNARRIMTNESYPTTITSEAKAPISTSSTTFSVEDVMTHNTPEDCYGVVSNKVYNLTAWADLHPGGKREILRLCGKDYTNSLTKGHPGGAPESESLLQTLEAYYLGDLAS